MSKVPAKFIGLSTTIGIQQPIGTYGGQIYLQKWCQPMVFPDVLYWPINYYHRYLKTCRHLCCLQKWCQPMVEIVFPDVFNFTTALSYTVPYCHSTTSNYLLCQKKLQRSRTDNHQKNQKELRSLLPNARNPTWMMKPLLR